MAQHQHSNQRTKPSKDRQGADKDRHPTPDDDDIHEHGDFKDQHVPLRDPSEGRSPAVIGQDVDAWVGNSDEQGEPQEHITIGVKGEPIWDGERDPDTIAEEQRRRSEDMQEQGSQAWMDAHDSRTDEQKADSQFVPEEPRQPNRGGNAEIIGSGGGRFDEGHSKRRLSYRQDEERAS